MPRNPIGIRDDQRLRCVVATCSADRSADRDGGRSEATGSNDERLDFECSEHSWCCCQGCPKHARPTRRLPGSAPPDYARCATRRLVLLRMSNGSSLWKMDVLSGDGTVAIDEFVRA